ncbi:NAD(P)-dependent dehydrogenase (short-subunit alcohol dehydrogenase family) [Novosphingobium sp. PhB165]|uniref:SDR family NAD(P)-dependent oxidoreductase n=1 Tax=Novosphingobium sp. PhB165 TaxID=2485105 RepID=UPI001049FF6B|nr:glucose 1-dehydrogenase [Novosphingobium sp. PhB165]TCM15014.1 NAD(P)-dependent dehydrogenase (short-subunit alcohol dehydrogenase family) [Novosphingobium sp. PhB165]
MELAGKVAVVTGGASGIGRATVELFAAEGAKVLIADIADEAGETLAERLGASAVYQRTDVSDPAAVEAMIEAAVSRFDGIDVLFNNAGMSCCAFPSFLDDTLEDFDRVMRVNVLGPMLGTRNAARIMARQGRGGVILNNASIAGTLAGHAMMTYRASKAALIQFSKSSAIDLARHGIRVNCIVPGHVRTELSSFGEKGAESGLAARIEEGVNAVYLSNQLIKRRGEPDDVAQVALFLASDRSRHMTGAVIPVEGGVTVGDPVNHLEQIFDARTAAFAAMERLDG